jgi:hypothetical protein
MKNKICFYLYKLFKSLSTESYFIKTKVPEIKECFDFKSQIFSIFVISFEISVNFLVNNLN